jgi:hypothetical protein
MKWVLIIGVLLLTGTVFADTLCERLQARARCRRILVRKNEVIVRFTCEEDAQIFARDLNLFIKD